MYTLSLMAPVKIQEVLKIVIFSILPVVLLGTMSNFSQCEFDTIRIE